MPKTAVFFAIIKPPRVASHGAGLAPQTPRPLLRGALRVPLAGASETHKSALSLLNPRAVGPPGKYSTKRTARPAGSARHQSSKSTPVLLEPEALYPIPPQLSENR